MCTKALQKEDFLHSHPDQHPVRNMMGAYERYEKELCLASQMMDTKKETGDLENRQVQAEWLGKFVKRLYLNTREKAKLREKISKKTSQFHGRKSLQKDKALNTNF